MRKADKFFLFMIKLMLFLVNVQKHKKENN